jgi:SAM-dependent methyltransferase
VGIDLMIERVMVARHETAAHNQRVAYATADACRLPFRDGVFDSTFCVAVLQHIGDVETAVSEYARVTRSGGRVLAVEPDNRARYSYSASPAGARAFETSSRFFSALAAARGESTNAAVGPRLPALFAGHAIEPLDVRLFPVSHARLGSPPEQVWVQRREVVERYIQQAPNEAVRALGREYLEVLDAYAAEAARAGPGFVEIQNTMLLATVGQKA